MKLKFKEGNNVEEMFGFNEKKIDKMLKLIADIVKSEKDFLEGVKIIYENAKNSKEAGYMLIYYVAVLHAIEFDNMFNSVIEEKDNINDIYR